MNIYITLTRDQALRTRAAIMDAILEHQKIQKKLLEFNGDIDMIDTVISDLCLSLDQFDRVLSNFKEPDES